AGVGNLIEPQKPDETTRVAAPAFGQQNIPATIDTPRSTPGTDAPASPETHFIAEKTRYQRGGDQLADYTSAKNTPANDAGPAKIAAQTTPSFSATLASV